MGSAQDRRTALAACRVAAGVEEILDLGQPRVDSDDYRGPLGEQVVAEAAAAVHLEQEAAEVAQLVVPRPGQGSTLATQDTSVRAARSDTRCLLGAPSEERHARDDTDGSG
jgi:hypothetical protein